MEVSGDLEPRASAAGENIEFVGAGGEKALRYSKLVAFDASGRQLPARMRSKGEKCGWKWMIARRSTR